ncbi:rhomboid family intramembrane serine protease [Enterobacteriaceae bacterium ESL0689]|nr:rhomboid family intramembrane serine protease [Enterobacteriaceae bacterium ESL0689]
MQTGESQSVMMLLSWPKTNVSPEIWRYVSHSLIHFSFAHLFSNMLGWCYLAGRMESNQGSLQLLILTLTAAITGGMAQFMANGIWFGGLSGVLYALTGFLWLQGERNHVSDLYLLRGLMLLTVSGLFIRWDEQPGIAQVAHNAGLMTGLLVACFL